MEENLMNSLNTALQKMESTETKESNLKKLVQQYNTAKNVEILQKIGKQILQISIVFQSAII